MLIALVYLHLPMDAFHKKAFILIKITAYMKKRAQIEQLVPWIIGFGVLILTGILYITLHGKGNAAVDFLQKLIRFGK